VNLKGAKLANADLRDVNLGPLLISNDRLLPARLERVDARLCRFPRRGLAPNGAAERTLLLPILRREIARDRFSWRLLQGIKLSLDGAWKRFSTKRATTSPAAG